MTEINPAIAKAIAELLREADNNQRKLIDAHAERYAQKVEALEVLIDQKAQVSKLDADLWREQSIRKIGDLEGSNKALQETLEEYSNELLALQEQNAQLIDAYAKANAEKLKPKGGFKSGTQYHAGDCVLRDGAAWWCTAEATDSDPREKSGEWRLLSMRGIRGEKGDSGPKGEQGKPGKPGADGVGILDARVNGFNMAFALSDGNALHVDLEPLKASITSIVRAEIKAAEKRK